MNMFLYNDYDDNNFIIVYWEKPYKELKKIFKKALEKTIKTYNNEYPHCDFMEELEWNLPKWIDIKWTTPLMYNDL